MDGMNVPICVINSISYDIYTKLFELKNLGIIISSNNNNYFKKSRSKRTHILYRIFILKLFTYAIILFNL